MTQFCEEKKTDESVDQAVCKGFSTGRLAESPFFILIALNEDSRKRIQNRKGVILVVTEKLGWLFEFTACDGEEGVRYPGFRGCVWGGY